MTGSVPQPNMLQLEVTMTSASAIKPEVADNSQLKTYKRTKYVNIVLREQLRNIMHGA